MKKLLAIMGLALLVLPAAQASILTNTNQSAQWVRMLSRNASTDIDAVYYNPAGLTQLADGFYLAVHNQTLFQEKTIINDYPLLHESTYVGKVSAPIFPSAFIAYKAGKLALSFGFGPNSGGGSADYQTGLPTFELPFTLIPLLMTWIYGIPTSDYAVDISFKGTSIFLGFQFNAAYAVTDWLSVAVGGRLLSATNTYEGKISGAMANTLWFGWIPLPGFSDMEVDAKQAGMGFTPIFNINIKPMANMNFSVKYEFQTKLELENQTSVDDTGMFPDGEKSRSDLPAILSFGLGYSIMPKLRIMGSFNFWFDKNLDWDGDPENTLSTNVLNLAANSWDVGVGFEFDLTEKFLVSAGFLHTQIDAGDDYQSDLRHELSSNTFGLGGQYKLSPNFDLNFGGLYSIYIEDQVEVGGITETYQRSSWGVSIGFGAHL